jgi:hypothetical protein
MVVQHMPTDGETLAALGRVAVRHGFLELVLRRTVKTLAGLTVDEADRALAYDGPASLRDLAKKLANQKLGSASQATLKLRAVLAECKSVTDRRNALFHGQWVEDEESAFMVGPESAMRIPTAAEITVLAEEIFAVANRLNQSRFRDGFLIAALTQAGKVSKSRED